VGSGIVVESWESWRNCGVGIVDTHGIVRRNRGGIVDTHFPTFHRQEIFGEIFGPPPRTNHAHAYINPDYEVDVHCFAPNQLN
jgi:hypothetical protein